MSLDIVDDLHAAEDEIGRLRHALNLIHSALSTPFDWSADTFDVISPVMQAEGYTYPDEDDPIHDVDEPLLSAFEPWRTFDPYCRPSCHGKFIPGPPIADESGTLWDDEACADDCGCPCGHNGEEPQ